MKHLRTIAGICLGAVLFGGMAVYAVTNYGSQDDPLITLSYLNDVLKPELEQKYLAGTEEALSQLESQVEAVESGAYKAVTLTKDQVMTCQPGCTFLVRSGSAYVSEGMLNLTAGESSAKNDWLKAHNLYMAVGDSDTVTASGETLLLVRGEYTIA